MKIYLGAGQGTYIPGNNTKILTYSTGTGLTLTQKNILAIVNETQQVTYFKADGSVNYISVIDATTITFVTVANMQSTDIILIVLDIPDTTVNYTTGVVSTKESNPPHLRFNSTIPICAVQPPTSSYVVAGSSWSGEGLNVHRINYVWVQGGGVTESYFKIIGRKATADTNVFGIENLKFDTISPVIVGKDTDGINIYRLISVATQKFAFTIFTDNNIPELEIQIKAAGTTLTTSNVTIDVNSSFTPPATKCDTLFYDYAVEVQRNRVPGVGAINKFGAAPSGIQLTRTDIWGRADATPTQQIWIAPTTARIHALVSTSTNDDGNPVGTGARTVRIYGLKTWDLAETSEDIILDGTTPVNTVNSYVIIHRMKVLTSGSASINVGTISATAATDNTVTAIISPGDGQTEMAIYGVPSTHTFMIKAWGANIDKTGATAVTTDFELRVNENPNVQLLNFLRKDDISLITTGTSTYEKCKHIPIAIPGPAIVKVQATASAADTDGEAWFDGYLVQN
jgi:hypothetical protein